MAEHPPSNPMNKFTDKQLYDMILPYVIRPEKGITVWIDKDEDETKFVLQNQYVAILGSTESS